MTTESHEFKAEIQQLLNILVHSLYTERDIFLRELISNASDALSRLQFEMLTNRDVLDPDAELKISVECDKDAKTITVRDTGIGLTRDEMVENLGTIAHSGAAEFMKRLQAEKKPADVIGQFGVGFYSVYMVADEVSVTSRSYRPDAQAVQWTSKGDNTYTLEDVEKADRGTVITVKLKEDAAEYAEDWKLEQIIKKHSDFVSFPIYVKDKAVNRQTAIWRQSARDVTAEQYDEFYKHLTLDFDAPLTHIHMVADVPVDIHAILFVPAKRERGIFSLRKDDGLKLYSRKILISEYFKDLLPQYFRFIQGVVDSEDLPLNVSREAIQNNRAAAKLKSTLTHKVATELADLGEKDAAKYTTFWQEFGQFIKEGIATDPANQTDLAKLLRFKTSRSGDEWVALQQVVDRLQADQTSIYYILGEDLTSVARSPHLDYFRQHDLEVLYLVEPIDSFMIMTLKEFAGKKLQNVDDAALELPKDDKPIESKVENEDFAQLAARIKTTLGEAITEVRESQLLTDSPCRLVSPTGETDRDMQRVRRMLGQDYEVPKKIMEINRGHTLIADMATLAKTGANDVLLDACIHQLFESSLLLEGLLPNPAAMVPRIQQLMEAAAKRI
ncbi:MAG: molecular chaperone HtpG [Thermoflexales bacterium]|nr:molecular chaperone HtpG [Thermoflexales bacterium]